MLNEIENRVKELNKEIVEHQALVNKHTQAANQLGLTVISKKGAIIELNKLKASLKEDKKEEEPNGNKQKNKQEKGDR